MKVLVVDDDPDQLIVRSMLISHHGFETIGAADADSAARLARSKWPDAAVVDINLPTREIGLRLLTELKAANPRMHLIVLTGTDPGKLKHHPEMQLANEVLVKGSSAKALLVNLARAADVAGVQQ